MKSSVLITGLLSLIVASQAEMLRLQLHHVGENPIIDAFHSLTSVSNFDASQVPFSRQQQLQQKGFRGSIPMRGYYRQIAVIELGNPPQSFRAALDLASSNTYVVSSQCIQATCINNRKYNASASSTNHRDGRTFSIPGTTNGIISQDTLYIAGAEVPHQEFGEAFSFYAFAPGFLGFDASLGLAYDGDKRDGNSVTGRISVVRNFLANRQIGQPVFTLYLGSSRPNAPSGELTIGGLEHRRFSGAFSWHGVVKRGQWIVSVKGAAFKHGDRVSRIDFNRIEAPTLVDPDYSLILLANQPAYYVNERLGAYSESKKEQYRRRCEGIEELTPVAVWIDRSYYWFTPQEAFIRAADGVTCISIFQEISFVSDEERHGRGYEAILGAVFLKKYYSAYDYGSHRVGFALAT
ncbi:Vacuolar protease A [Linnemannia schmuckeri]|uniref:Vacuolar protease A n=1 Tax=Linnemannia schmuckeri TaxID=64567 RepID=A0A9P5RYT7_9FUNG|nr:Vacuolar protease A [Linnemannia schmuckeri]